MELNTLIIAEEKTKKILKDALLPFTHKGLKVDEAKMSKKALDDLNKEIYHIIFFELKQLLGEEIEFLRTLRNVYPMGKIIPIFNQEEAPKIASAMSIDESMYLVHPLREEKIKEILNNTSFLIQLDEEFKEKKLIPKIIILDDDKFFGEYLENILIKGGYEAWSFQSPLKALEAFKEDDFNILLIDLIMDEMSGEEFIKYTKTLNPDVLIIIITAYPTFDSVLSAIKTDVYDYIIKPFNERDVLMVIKRGWERQKLLKYKNFLTDYIKNKSIKVE